MPRQMAGHYSVQVPAFSGLESARRRKRTLQKPAFLPDVYFIGSVNCSHLANSRGSHSAAPMIIVSRQQNRAKDRCCSQASLAPSELATLGEQYFKHCVRCAKVVSKVSFYIQFPKPLIGLPIQ